MANLNDTEILFTFDVLNKLEINDILARIDKCSALSICEKSMASPSDIYHLWVHKLLRAFFVNELGSESSQEIVDYLRNVLHKFVKNLETLNNETAAHKLLIQWWQDTKDMLNWLTTNIKPINSHSILLIVILVLEVVIKTKPYSSHSDNELLLEMLKLIVVLANNYILKMSINKTIEFKHLNIFASGICDVANLIFNYDMKTSVEIYRIAAKLSEKAKNCYQSLSGLKFDNLENWHEKAILGVFKELNLLILFFKQNQDKVTEQRLLQLCQFYLKILKLFINHSGYKTNNYPDKLMSTFMKVYILCQHDFSVDKKSKINLCLKDSLIDIFSLFFKEKNMIKLLWKHMQDDENNFDSCDLVVDILNLIIKNKHLDITFLLKLYQHLFKGPKLFVDGDKYYNVLEKYAALCILDSTTELHKHMCEYITDISWVREFASMQILSMYYSFLFQNGKNTDSIEVCLQYWCNMWNKLNRSTETTHINQKHLVEILLETIIKNTDDTILQNLSNKIENFQIILLLSGKVNDHLKQYFQINLVKLLKKLQQKRINKMKYNELINLLEIGALRREMLNNTLNVSLLETFFSLFSLTTTEFAKFFKFLDKSLGIFYLEQDKELNEKLLKHLTEHVQHCCSIYSANLIEFLLKQKPQSNELLEKLQTENNIFKDIMKYVDFPIDVKIFQNLKTQEQSTNIIEMSTIEQINKKPRLDETEQHALNVKHILKDMKLNSQKLICIKHACFDENDFEALNEIKSNIDKCLSN